LVTEDLRMSGRPADKQERLYALDGLRGTMMLLGLVFHGACSYVTTDITKIWPYHDVAQSAVADFAMSFLHAFRMPVFFVLAGFFAAMLYARRGAGGLLENRFQRIGIPFVVGLFILFPATTFAFTFAVVAATSSLNDAWAAVVTTAAAGSSYLPRITLHLWFLYYLLYFYVGAVAIAAACNKLPDPWRGSIAQGFRRLIERPVLRVVVLAVPTALILVPMRGYLTTGVGFVPNLYTVLAYGIFFGFGWLLYAQRDVLAGFTRFAWIQVAGATALYFVVKYAVAPLFGADQYTGGALALWSAAGGIVAWMMFFGTTGLFLRYFNKPSALARYVVDGSYWVYLVHLPVLMFLVGLLADTNFSAVIKMAIVIPATALIGFVSYDLVARATFIGRALNGQRYPRALGALLPNIVATAPRLS